MRNRFVRTLGAVMALTAGCALAQTPAPPPVFEVATVKPAGPMDPAKMMSGQMRLGMSIDAARVDIGFFSLADLIRTAYRVKPYQVSGPDWMPTARFDIHAKLPEGGQWLGEGWYTSIICVRLSPFQFAAATSIVYDSFFCSSSMRAISSARGIMMPTSGKWISCLISSV